MVLEARFLGFLMIPLNSNKKCNRGVKKAVEISNRSLETKIRWAALINLLNRHTLNSKQHFRVVFRVWYALAPNFITTVHFFVCFISENLFSLPGLFAEYRGSLAWKSTSEIQRMDLIVRLVQVYFTSTIECLKINFLKIARRVEWQNHLRQVYCMRPS